MHAIVSTVATNDKKLAHWLAWLGLLAATFFTGATMRFYPFILLANIWLTPSKLAIVSKPI